MLTFGTSASAEIDAIRSEPDGEIFATDISEDLSRCAAAPTANFGGAVTAATVVILDFGTGEVLHLSFGADPD